MNLNKVFLIGRLTQDPESRSTQSGQTVTTLRLATNRMWTDPAGQKKSSVEYHTIVAWGRLGEITAQYLRKGNLMMVEGRMQTRSWTGQDNVKRYSTEVVAENIQMGPRSATSGQPPSPSGSERPEKPESKDDDIPIIGEDEPTVQGVEEEDVPIKEKDLPF